MKNTIKFCIIILIMLAGIVSCTDGYSLGTGGGGNLNIIDMPSEYNNQYIKVTGTLGTSPVSFDPAAPYVQISGGKASAPLYFNNGTLYTGNDSISIDVEVYVNNGALTPTLTKALGVVRFYSGSGVVYWK